MSLNQFQKAVAQKYGGGDYAHVETIDECREAGDTLFLFIMLELAEKGMDADTATFRMERALDDVQTAIDAIGAM